MMKRVAQMDEDTLVRLHDLDLLAESIRLRALISEQAEAERAAGKWDDLTEVIRAYRNRNRQS